MGRGRLLGRFTFLAASLGAREGRCVRGIIVGGTSGVVAAWTRTRNQRKSRLLGRGIVWLVENGRRLKLDNGLRRCAVDEPVKQQFRSTILFGVGYEPEYYDGGEVAVY